MASPKPEIRLAIVGGDTLIGRELRDLISDHRLAGQLDLVADRDEEPAADADDDDALVQLPLNARSLSGAKVIFLAGGAGSSRRAAELAPHAFLIDLSGELKGALRAPSAEPERYLAPEAQAVSIAQPGAILLASLLRKLTPLGPIERTVATLFEPASQRGRHAVEELQQQAIGLLSFREIPQAEFGAQLCFNLLPRFGTETQPALLETEREVAAELAMLCSLAPALPLPSIRVAQAPVFHGYVASVWVRFQSPVDIGAVENLLKPQTDYRGGDTEPPSNVGVAGQSGLAVDAARLDAGDPHAIWIWAVADNLRLLADNAMLTAAAILEQATRPVQ